jgi:putative DNA primase/helicase
MDDKKTGRNGGDRATRNSNKHLKYSPAARSKKERRPSFSGPRHRSEPTIHDRIRDALAYIDPSSRDLWVRIGMAIKSELGDDGFEIWNAWSQQDESYNARDARSVWNSIRPDGGITIGTLFWEASAKWLGERPMTDYQTQGASAERGRDTAGPHDNPHEPITPEQQATAAAAVKVYEAASPLNADHPYVVRKGIQSPPILREIDADRAEQLLGYPLRSKGQRLHGRVIVVPVKNATGRLNTLELIDEDGRKTALRGHGTKNGGYWAHDLP